MSLHMARDLSVWNRLKYGNSREPSPDSSESIDEKTGFWDEKQGEEEEQKCGERKWQEPKKPKAGARSSWLWIGIGIVLYMCFSYSCPSIEVEPHTPHQGYVDYGDPLNNFESLASEQYEVISVGYPYVPRKSYGLPVHSVKLVDHVFDNWGHPSVGKLRIPDVKFDRVVLTLNTSVSGVQYDRLAHLYVGGAEIWRTSTAEPGSRDVFSTYKKDVSNYLALFKHDARVVFQLDNVVTRRLTGKFHVELYADFYNNEKLHYLETEDWPESNSYESDGQSVVAVENSENGDDEVNGPAEKYKYFDNRRPADKVIPLVKESSNKIPLKYLPDKVSLSLPQVSRNTTRLKVAVFTSGNAQEEFWYSNVLDQYKDVFQKEGYRYLGHGPLRFVSVWLDGKKIASQPPQPFIFTGGYSPTLWSPVVATNAFDLPSVDLDISSLLPLLWESGDHTLEITVDNAYDEVDGTSSGIGRDWITSANLLTYENADVKHASGKLLDIDHQDEASEHSAAIPYVGTLVQSTRGFFSVKAYSLLELELKNGETLNVTVSNLAQSTEENVQLYLKLGRTSRYVHRGVAEKGFSLYDNDEEETIHEYLLEVVYPLVFSLSETRSDEGLDLAFNIVNTKLTTLLIGGKKTRAETVTQSGKSNFHIRSLGNFGDGELNTNYKTQITGPTLLFEYKRAVVSKDGEIVLDNEEYKDLEEADWSAYADAGVENLFEY